MHGVGVGAAPFTQRMVADGAGADKGKRSGRLVLIACQLAPALPFSAPVRNAMEPLGIIAGNGEFPLTLARSARQLGIERLVAAAFDGETKPEVRDVVDEIEWVKLGQLNKLIEVFTSRGVKRAVMAGGITPSNLFK